MSWVSCRLFVPIGVALELANGGCVGDPHESWLPSEIEVADTLEKVGHFAYSTMCNELENRVHDLYTEQPLVQAACTAYALRTTRNAAECAQVTDDCLTDLPPPVEAELDTILAQASCASTGVSAAECKSPVFELVDCLEGLWDQVEGIRLEATCAAFGSPVSRNWWRITIPTACSELATRCPAHT
jgi:hypothetical protein